MALHYCVFPGRYSAADRLGLLLMLAAAGSGKTHMIDEIPRSASKILNWKQKQLEEALLRAEGDITANTSEDQVTLSLLNARKTAAQGLLDDLAVMREEVNKKIFFVPISFNSHVRVEFDEEDLDVSQLLVSRILFCYFCVGLDFVGFRERFKDLFPRISVRMALEIVRYDQSHCSGKRVAKPFNTSRAVLLIDEVSKVSSCNEVEKKKKRQEELYTLLRQVFLGLFPFPLLTCWFHCPHILTSARGKIKGLLFWTVRGGQSLSLLVLIKTPRHLRGTAL